MRQATVYVKKVPAAVLTQRGAEGTPGAFSLQYLPEYVARAGAGAISVRLPRRSEPFESPTLFPFFESLLPEGEFARQLCREARLDPHDRFGMLLTLAGTETLGDVTVQRRKETENDA